VSRQQSADERKKLAPLTKKIKMLEAGLEKLQKQLTLVEAQLAETDIYNDDQKYQLKKSLSDQADIKRNIGAIEEDWLQCQDSLENT
jgi:ATP-binding cassette subfamily F protein 3